LVDETMGLWDNFGVLDEKIWWKTRGLKNSPEKQEVSMMIDGIPWLPAISFDFLRVFYLFISTRSSTASWEQSSVENPIRMLYGWKIDSRPLLLIFNTTFVYIRCTSEYITIIVLK
jgi:hypothetical protein